MSLYGVNLSQLIRSRTAGAASHRTGSHPCRPKEGARFLHFKLSSETQMFLCKVRCELHREQQDP